MKICAYNNCGYPVFSHLYCKNHQWARTDAKRKNTPNKYINYDAFYAHIFSISNRRCAETGERIGYPQRWNFHHILPKNPKHGFPEFSRDERNIILLSPEPHDQWEISSWDNRRKMKIWEQCRETAFMLLQEIPDDDKRKIRYLEFYL